MLTGAAIGLVIWAIYVFVTAVSLKRNERLDYRFIVLALVVLVAFSGSIGFLISVF